MVPFLHGALMNDGEHLARVISNNYADNLCIIPTPEHDTLTTYTIK